MEWLTPPHILAALGEFDLDPCAAVGQPWRTARTQWTRRDDGLARKWFGVVWLNPPYGKEAARWLAMLAAHGNGMALVFARTETAMFFASVWGAADGVLFLRGRPKFCYPDGAAARGNSGGPLVLIAYGRECADRLKGCGLGWFVATQRGERQR